jgi:protein-S-isoprenylcysteine O-methyltransferase Ste14
MKDRLSRWGIGPRIAAAALAYAVLARLAAYRWPDLCRVRFVPYAVVAPTAVILLVIGMCMLALALRSATKAYNRDQLVTSGIFAVVRHPIYSAWIVFIVPGVALLSRSWPVLLTPVVAYTVFKLSIHQEDEYLQQRFGQAYLDYRGCVNEIIPLAPALGRLMNKKVRLALSGILAVLAAVATYSSMQVRATPAEETRTLPGDDLIPQPIGSVNHAITIRRPPHDVWPWLVQMGSGRAGWYAYDFIDNGGHRSAERILPEYQSMGVGSVFPALPGVKDVFLVGQCEPEHSLVLSWRLPSGHYQTTWAFVLEQAQPDQTRLIVRGRVASGYRPYGLPQWLALSTGRLAHFIMQRKQLLGIARRAEARERRRP